MKHNNELLVAFKPQIAKKIIKDTFYLRDALFSWEALWESDLTSLNSVDAPDTIWLMARPDKECDIENNWELAHDLRRSKYLKSLGPNTVHQIEPNSPTLGQIALASYNKQTPPPFVPRGGFPRGDCVRRREQDPFWERGKGFAWHLGKDHTQLTAASKRVGDKPAGKRIRIGHIDTGYDPRHVTCPIHIVPGYNYHKDNSDTSDTNGGLFQGHGTGTIGPLAGNVYNDGKGFNDYIGGAPFAEVVPIVASNVVIIWATQASWAKSVRFAIDHGCDVISMSAGGYFSGVLAGQIKEAVRRGIAVFAAAGNHYPAQGGTDMSNLTFPAIMSEVMAVGGAMANHRPYQQTKDQLRYSANFGPTQKMNMALAAYTPNTARPRLGCPNMVDMNGDGTSAATPQAAAAAALWLQMHGNKLEKKQRPRAVYKALQMSAETKYGDRKYYGRGILRANAALDITPEAVSAQMQDSDQLIDSEPVICAAVTAISAFSSLDTLSRSMFETEGAQIDSLSQTPDYLESFSHGSNIDEQETGNPKLSESLYQFMQSTN